MFDRQKVVFVTNIFLFIDNENSVTISETREYLVLVISGNLFAICRVNLAFSAVCLRFFVIMFTVNVVNSFQSMF